MLCLLLVLCLASSVYTKKEFNAELNSIIRGPETFAKQYLSKLNLQLRRQTASLFNPELQASIISNFESTFGVEVTINSPFGGHQQAQAACSSAQYTGSAIIPSDNITTVSLSIPESGTLVSVNVSDIYFSRYTKIDQTQSPHLTLISPNGTSVLFYDADCNIISNYFDASFEDGAPEVNCTEISDGLTWGIYYYSFSSFEGVSINGQWQLELDNSDVPIEWQLQTWTLNYCYTFSGIGTEFSSDFAKANTNFDGFRYDPSSGTYFLTSIYYNAAGEAFYLTISTNNPELFKK